TIDSVFPLVFNLEGVATAVIEVPLPPGAGDPPEYRTSDIRLDITRNGDIIHRQIYYNVPLAPGGLPTPDNFQFLDETSLYLALPPATAPDTFTLPENGNPPAFGALRDAVNAVLAADPGGTNIASEAGQLT